MQCAQWYKAGYATDNKLTRAVVVIIGGGGAISTIFLYVWTYRLVRRDEVLRVYLTERVITVCHEERHVRLVGSKRVLGHISHHHTCAERTVSCMRCCSKSTA